MPFPKHNVLFHHVTVAKIRKVEDSKCYIASSYPYKIILNLKLCCILRGPGGERIVDIVPAGMDLELQSRGAVGQAAHTRNNPHVKCTGVY